MLEIIAMQRPKDAMPEGTPSAEETLREFAALKTSKLSKFEHIKLWPYTTFPSASGHPGAVGAVSYTSKTGHFEYSIQFLVAEPGVIYMITFDVDRAEGRDMQKDWRRFDSILATAK
jgi:hypothetical protein